MEIFGFNFKKEKSKEEHKAIDISREENADTNVISAESGYGAHNFAGIQTMGLEGTLIPKEDIDLLEQYRTMALSAEVDQALQEIRNEVFVFDDPGKRAFDLNFKDVSYAPSKNIQKKIIEEYSYIYDLLEFDTKGQKYFDDWYVDGRLYAQKIIDTSNPKSGIKRIQAIDPMDIRKIRRIPKRDKDGTYDVNAIEEFYVYAKNMRNMYKKNNLLNSFSGYNEIAFNDTVQGMKIHPDAIAYASSGLFDRNEDRVLSYLYKAILPYNRLKLSEDSMLIFRVVRAPQRRAFYVDVGTFNSTQKADTYMQKLRANFKNKLSYDNKTGTLNTSTHIQSMLEDYWLPRRDGGKGTEIVTLDGQSTQDMLEEVQYYREKLYDALQVPKSRFNENSSTFNFGRDTTINRDEYRFTKFLSLLRRQFLTFVEDILKTQLILKKIITEEEWYDINRSLYWTFTEDNMFVEIKENESLIQKLNILSQVDPYIGKYYSRQQVRSQILRQTDEEQSIIDKQIAETPKEFDKDESEP